MSILTKDPERLRQYLIIQLGEVEIKKLNFRDMEGHKYKDGELIEKDYEVEITRK